MIQLVEPYCYLPSAGAQGARFDVLMFRTLFYDVLFALALHVLYMFPCFPVCLLFFTLLLVLLVLSYRFSLPRCLTFGPLSAVILAHNIVLCP